MGKRVILIVMDSFGIGDAPDAEKFGDAGTNTMKSCYGSSEFKADNLKKLGLFNIDGVDYAEGVDEPVGAYARMREASAGKDTTIGHWEIAGIISKKPLPTFPDGFPQDILTEIKKNTGRDVLCNKPYSGTKVINDYGDEHVKTGKLIVYTSADSVLQIAAHEDVVPLDELYEICRICRRGLIYQYGVGRVIARPFIGTSGNYTRTSNRHDFSLIPPANTMLDHIRDAGMDSIAIGKIYDIFAGAGITAHTYTTGNPDGIDKTIEYMDRDWKGIMFVNLVDYDMLYGHRRDIDGYARAVAYFDDKLPEIMGKMRDEDVLMITADHGCDPAFLKTTDHTRECVPFLMYGKHIKPGNIGTRNTFADIGATVLDYLGVVGHGDGSSVLS
ncbi:MAG: phosphopentomutase, partial [Lachnospiraceae bacterium]|nr:phosphopentomutase [Lachnospiraceae bacterium]